MPATGAIARTAVNVKAGARTRVAAITHSLVLVLVIAVAAGPVEHIPLAALAGVLMMTAIRMIDVATTRAILGSTRSDAVAYIITAIITVSVDLIVAVGIGIAVAAFLLLRTLSRTTTVTFEDLPGNPTHGDQHIATVRIDGPLFAAADRVLTRSPRSTMCLLLLCGSPTWALLMPQALTFSRKLCNNLNNVG